VIDNQGQANDVILNSPAAVSLTPKQARAVLALLTEPTVEAAAAAVGVTDRTIERWQQQPPFQAAYASARHKLFDEGLARLQGGVSKAVGILMDEMNNGTNAARRLRAATAFLRLALKAHEVFDLRCQLEEIQAELATYREQNQMFATPPRGAGFH
jgi:hypothetical protein